MQSIAAREHVCRSGIEAVGDLTWGAHFCHLYETREDLVEALVPFFAVGLANNEQCLWVASEPLDASQAKRALADHVPDLQSLIDRGQIQIIDHCDWYTRTGSPDAKTLLGAWLDAERAALARGYTGLRVTGNGSFLQDRDSWQKFERYEACVNETFAGHRLIGLCSYPLDMSRARDVLDVVRNHQFAVVRRGGGWEVLENAAIAVAKDELSKLNTELESRVLERTAELEQAVRDRDVAARSKDEFLAMLGHELRNPLAPILTAVQLMRLRGEHHFVREREIIERQANHLVRLVDDLLDVSRIARGKIELQRRPIELATVVAQAVEQASSAIAEKAHQLHVRVPSGLAVEADSTRLAQVFANLLGNAVKYSPIGGRIDVTADASEHTVAVAVHDNGRGIDRDLLSGIFDLFVQGAQGADRAQGGLGLGLAIAKRLVEMHGGCIRADSEGPGAGSTFTVELPRIPNRLRGRPSIGVNPTTATNRRRVLVVDDNQDAADLVAESLDLLGYSVDVAYDAAQALALADATKPTVAILDLGLPGMDGYELANALRAQHGDCPPMMIALSGYGQPADVDRTTAAGFAAHLVKPVSLPLLEHHLETLQG